jgi:hypothetical protein
MTSFQTVWLILLVPLFFIYSLLEIRRGWKILRYRDMSLNPALQTRVWIINIFKGREFAKNYQENLMNNKTGMKMSGVYSLAGGVLMLIVSFYWGYMFIQVFLKR